MRPSRIPRRLQPRRALRTRAQGVVLGLGLLAAATGSAAAPSRVPPPVRTATWGFETWQCGSQWFDVRLGSGSDVTLDRIDGVASAIAGPNADMQRRWVRAALVTLTPAGPTPPTPGAVVATPAERAQQAMAGNLLSVILKQRGEQAVHLPISQAYLAPPVLSGGRLRVLIDTQTYTGDAGPDARVPLDHPEECLDTELQLVVQFHERG